MEDLVVLRATQKGLLPVGTIVWLGLGEPVFSYFDEYLESPSAIPLSQSLPLDGRPYKEGAFRPYFEGLLPEGPMRTALAASLGAREQDYLTLLGCSGFDCIGDVVVRQASDDSAWDVGSYVPLDEPALVKTLTDLNTLTASNLATRLSLAGTQGKVGLAHAPNESIRNGWFRPLGGAASTHILKTSGISRIEELELLCMVAAKTCGIRVARTEALMLGKPVVVSERFDRRVLVNNEDIVVERLHQEDIAQAYGVTSPAKYQELDGGTYRAIAELIYKNSSSVLEDIGQLARVAVFDYIVGNCDNHLKNVSVVYEGKTLRLAPAYDIVCTTYFERFSREMGRRLGSTRDIDNVRAQDFDLLARDLRMGARRMRRICAELSERVVPAVMAAGERLCHVVETLPYTAEDLINDMTPRLAVLT